MKAELVSIIEKSLLTARSEGDLRSAEVPPILLEIPKDESNGDYATPLAMGLASHEKRSPRQIAEVLVRHMQKEQVFEKIEIAGPGFINFFFRKAYWWETLRGILQTGDTYGQVDAGGGIPVQVEFVSANPTGPLHVGHGRGAAFGDSLANLLDAAGYRVQREYYINDVGRQMETLGRSTWIRYRQLLGQSDPFPEDGYQGDYIREIAQLILHSQGDRYLEMAEKEVLPFFIQYTKENILDGIRKDLQDFGVTFHAWFSERTLYEQGAVDRALATLRERGHLYDQEGAQWLRTTAFGDDKDRVVVRSSGQMTYFASDIAYHQEKFQRGFQRIIDIWGADHHGYEPRLRAMAQCLGYPAETLNMILVQLVTLVREGKPVSMSTRSGEFVTLREVMDEVGRDAARFIFLTRRSDSPLDFDLDVAKKKSQENPVYYVQYAYARIASLFRQAEEKGIVFSSAAEKSADLSRLDQPEEIRMIKLLAGYPDIVRESALALEPHRVTFFLLELAGVLHPYYFRYRIITEDQALTLARLTLMRGIQGVLRHALKILGVSAPERM
ncbi:MAG: arginine--tRNA ligase [Nitrospirae bacterium]|nr:arginine--tRNA ligase [Nitrospirota bacterium]